MLAGYQKVMSMTLDRDCMEPVRTRNTLCKSVNADRSKGYRGVKINITVRVPAGTTVGLLIGELEMLLPVHLRVTKHQHILCEIARA